MLPCPRFLVACLLVSLGGCGEMAVKSPPQKSEIANDQSWSDFQKALKNRDIERVASMVEFPLPNDLEGLDGFDGIGSRKTFRRDFSTLFPEVVIQTLLDYSPTAAEIRSGSWSVAHNEPGEISEDEWSMFYQFILTSDGMVRLRRIQMAG